MHQFYFNDCLPSNSVSLVDLELLFLNSIKEFSILLNKKIGIDRGLILEKDLTDIIICENRLKEIIASFKNKDLRILVYSYFTKFPIQKVLKSHELDSYLLEEEYQWQGLDAINLAIAKYNDCFIFSIAVHESLKYNNLQLNGKSKVINIDNLYGVGVNTSYIESQIIRKNSELLTIFEQLCIELDNPIYTPNFKKTFINENQQVQSAIIEMFKRAKKRNFATPYYPDTKIIKDVTPNKKETQKGSVYELRIYEPKALRIYFCEYQGKVFIARIGYKASDNQSEDIILSLREIDRMIKTN